MATGLVPSAARTIEADVTITRVSNTYNDGYADDLSLMLSSAAACVGDCVESGR